MKIRLIIAVITVLCAETLFAQQQSLYSQYMLNGFLYNPAIAGSDGFTSINLTAREQWLGFENAPKTRSLSVQGRILKRGYGIKSGFRKKLQEARSGRVGLGAMIYNDKNGLIDRTGAQGTYAYHIFINNSQLSFGLSGSLFQFRINRDGMLFKNPDDPLNISELNRPIYVPDASAGIFFVTPDYYAGASVSQLFQSPLKLGNHVLENYKMFRHYYITAGYSFSTGNGLEFVPSFLLQYTDQLIAQTDISLKAYYNESYWIGASYRTSGVFILLAGFKLDRFYLGYSFDYTFSSIRKHSYGSHELMLVYKLGDNARRYKWINRY